MALAAAKTSLLFTISKDNPAELLVTMTVGRSGCLSRNRDLVTFFAAHVSSATCTTSCIHEKMIKE